MSHPSHRGPSPEDHRLFSDEKLGVMRQAAFDLCWLLDRGYALSSGVELVGNRYALAARQRMALSRSVCSCKSLELRAAHQVPVSELRGNALWIDGYNLLTILETALAGGMIFVGRDRCCRDIAGVHRRYRTVEETLPAFRTAGQWAFHHGVSSCHWWLDQPVSNSGRLKSAITSFAEESGWKMQAEVTFNPDQTLAKTSEIIASSDGVILDRCARWFNLATAIIADYIPSARVIDLSPSTEANA